LRARSLPIYNPPRRHCGRNTIDGLHGNGAAGDTLDVRARRSKVDPVLPHAAEAIGGMRVPHHARDVMRRHELRAASIKRARMGETPVRVEAMRIRESHGRQRCPTDIAASDPPVHPGWPPRVAGHPGPSDGVEVRPASVVKRRPPPRVAGLPRPAVVRVHPLPAGVRREVGTHDLHAGNPDGSVRRVVVPAAIRRQGGLEVAEGHAGTDGNAGCYLTVSVSRDGGGTAFDGSPPCDDRGQKQRADTHG
jgi:hypothetical protein